MTFASECGPVVVASSVVSVSTRRELRVASFVHYSIINHFFRPPFPILHDDTGI